MRKFAAILAVFNSKGEILLGRRNDNGKWTCPGGHREEGETPEETAIRELKEEAGLVTDNLGHLGDGIVAGADGMDHHVQVFKTVTDDEPDSSGDPDNEVDKWEWIPTKNGLPKEIYQNLHVPPVKNLLFPLCDVDLVPEDFDEENWEDENGREEDLEKAISDIPRGQRMNTSHIGTTYSYNHVLSNEQKQNGYRLQVRHQDDGTSHRLTATVLHGMQVAGTVGAKLDPVTRKLRIGFSSLEKPHRGQGLGMAAYEALMAHAKHTGATAVVGDLHSSAAHGVHSAVSKKHGMGYQATESTVGDKLPGDYDNRYNKYEYAIKSEMTPEFCQFEEDVVAWCVFQDGLNKSVKHSLMGLAAATMLNFAPSTAQAPPDTSTPKTQSIEQPPAEQPLPKQELNAHMKAVIKNPTTLQSKSVGMTGDSGQSVIVPQSKMAPRNHSMQWHFQGLPREMMAIARNESNVGQYWDHAKNQAGPFWTAYGPLGLKPATAYDEFRMPHMAAVRRSFPGLENPTDFLNEIRVNPNLYNAVATGHWNRLKNMAGGDDEKAAYGWNQGVGALQVAMQNGDDVSDHDYVSKYRQHKQRLMGLASR